jgi:hypothetical protein
MFELEKYRGQSTRHTCPACGFRREFTRYVDLETGDYLDPNVGRCNRQGKCGYHLTPKEYFEANPDMADAFCSAKDKRKRRAKKPHIEPPAAKIERAPFISPNLFLKTLANYEKNAFVGFLFDLFPDDAGAVRKAVKDYFLGTTRDGYTIFWQIDRWRNIRTGKIIAYDRQSGKRQKYTNWIHAILKNRGEYPENAQPIKCLFGEHLLGEDTRPAAIVEAEKTAVIASICFPQFIWLATGGLDQLKAWKMQALADRKIILYPDAKGFARWSQIAQDAAVYGLTINVSSLLENFATEAEKQKDSDLADYLIEELRSLNLQDDRAELTEPSADEDKTPTEVEYVEQFEYVEMVI